MPEKQNENKFMAMLERKGIVRKADSEDDVSDKNTGGAQSRPDADLRSLFGSTDVDATNVTPAARQPVPGMSKPILPSEQTQDAKPEQPRPTERVEPLQSAPVERVDAVTPLPVERTEPTPPPPVERTEPTPTPPVERTEPTPTPPVERTETTPPLPVEPRSTETPRATMIFGSLDNFKDDRVWAEEQEPEPDPEPEAVDTYVYREAAPQPQQAENYTDRYLEIDELFEALSLRTKKTDTIYLVEDYLKSLPDSLPDESRRDIVGKIVAASGFDYDLLMGDGVLRVKMLKDYAERFAGHTEDYVSARQAEVDELNQQILRIRRLIENRRELHKKQFLAIEAEAQRLKEILTFISG